MVFLVVLLSWAALQSTWQALREFVTGVTPKSMVASLAAELLAHAALDEAYYRTVREIRSLLDVLGKKGLPAWLSGWDGYRDALGSVLKATDKESHWSLAEKLVIPLKPKGLPNVPWPGVARDIVELSHRAVDAKSRAADVFGAVLAELPQEVAVEALVFNIEGPLMPIAYGKATQTLREQAATYLTFWWRMHYLLLVEVGKASVEQIGKLLSWLPDEEPEYGSWVKMLAAGLGLDSHTASKIVEESFDMVTGEFKD